MSSMNQQHQSSHAGQQQSFPVVLAIYDLSRGMARNLSARFLGGPQFAIDAIPHTGIVVYGREYFFGGGIQSEDPIEFRRDTGLQPIQLLPVGQTTVPKMDFERWCQDAMMTRRNTNGQPSYSMESYDLFTNNCNNFCYDAISRLGLPANQVFPLWILDVPQRFLNSPMGQMVRPMLQSMQITNVAHAQPIGTSSSNHNGSTTTTAAAATAPASSAPNPWANLGGSSSSSAAGSSTNMTTEAKAVATTNDTTDATNGSNINMTATTTLLDSLTQKPLLFNDTQVVDLCIRKLFGAATENKNNEIFQEVAPILRSTAPNNKQLSTEQTERICSSLLNILEDDKCVSAARTAYALMLFRLVVLRCGDDQTASAAAPTTTSRVDVLEQCIQWILTQLSSSSSSKEGEKKKDDKKFIMENNPTVRTAAWLAGSNAVAAAAGSKNNNDAWVEAAIPDVSHTRPEIRQAACAVLYNTTFGLAATCNDHDDNEMTVSDTHVSMLCAVLEGLVEEKDAVCQLRRLLVVGRIMKKRNNGTVHAGARQLVMDLGFGEALEQVAASSTTSEQCRNIAKELVLLLDQQEK